MNSPSPGLAGATEHPVPIGPPAMTERDQAPTQDPVGRDPGNLTSRPSPEKQGQGADKPTDGTDQILQTPTEGREMTKSTDRTRLRK
jgi:hypothetical protein